MVANIKLQRTEKSEVFIDITRKPLGLYLFNNMTRRSSGHYLFVLRKSERVKCLLI